MAQDSWRGWLPRDVIREADQPIYHYTDAGGLLGAVKDHQLWATEATGLNDLAEVTQGWKFIREWAAEQDATKAVIKMVVDKAGTDDEDDDDDEARSREGLFMCCASLRRDDANQWRLYGGGGRGYALELNPQMPLAVLVDGRRPLPGTLALLDYAPVTPWLNVLYTEIEKVKALDGLVAAATEELEQYQHLASRFHEGGV